MFKFKQFTIVQDQCAMKVGTDGVMLGAWAEGGWRVLDIGTGTGLIALMMAQRYPDAKIVAIDIDEPACRQAADNVAASPFAGRIEVVQADVRIFMQEGEPASASLFDAIVSNPPFFANALKAPDQQRSVARHDSTLSYQELMAAAHRLLTEDGVLSVVVPFDYRKQMEDEAVMMGLFLHRVTAVRTVVGKPARRYLLSFRKHPCERQFEWLTIGDDEYRRLTGDFYL